MPSAKDTSFLIDVMPEPTNNGYLSRDVDVLVSQIKENLRLSNNLKSRSSLHPTKMRVSPYKIPATTRCPSEPPTSYSCYKNKEQHHEDYDDSHERLQSLLRQGALIKEAVKRLRATDFDLISLSNHHHRRSNRASNNFNSANSTTLDSSTDQEEGDDDFVDSDVDETDEERENAVDRQNTLSIACRIFDEQRCFMEQR